MEPYDKTNFIKESPNYTWASINEKGDCTVLHHSKGPCADYARRYGEVCVPVLDLNELREHMARIIRLDPLDYEYEKESSK